MISHECKDNLNFCEIYRFEVIESSKKCQQFIYSFFLLASRTKQSDSKHSQSSSSGTFFNPLSKSTSSFLCLLHHKRTQFMYLLQKQPLRSRNHSLTSNSLARHFTIVICLKMSSNSASKRAIFLTLTLSLLDYL